MMRCPNELKRASLLRNLVRPKKATCAARKLLHTPFDHPPQSREAFKRLINSSEIHGSVKHMRKKKKKNYRPSILDFPRLQHHTSFTNSRFFTYKEETIKGIQKYRSKFCNLKLLSFFILIYV